MNSLQDGHFGLGQNRAVRVRDSFVEVHGAEWFLGYQFANAQKAMQGLDRIMVLSNGRKGSGNYNILTQPL